MKRLLTTTIFIFLFITTILAQKNTLIIEGYVFAEDNSGYLSGAKVTLLTATKTFKGEVITDDLGKFEFEVKADEPYLLRVRKTGFNDEEMEFSTVGKSEKETVYLNVALKRAPGYIFEATIADWRAEDSNIPVDAIEGATIEVYNKTTREVILDLKNHQYHTFNFRMEQGNTYVILLRKRGYFNKRIDANISINGCILCIEGVGITRPGVTDNLTDNNMTGTLGANISMKKITMEESVKVDNIYYDLGRFDIRQDAMYELDKLVSVLIDNPQISIELSSHTDSRGEAKSNLDLSQKRAEAAAQYMIEQGISTSRIKAKGYGELKLVNNCEDGTNCSETEHQDNRRTEFKVISITADETEMLTLEQMMEKELFDENLEGLMFQEVVYVEGKTDKSTVYESYEGTTKPQKIDKPQTNRTSILSETDEEYVDYQPIKGKNKSLRTEYTIKDDPFGTAVLETKSDTERKSKEDIVIYRTKKVSQTYTGYKIELLVSDELLNEEHRLFREMGGIEMDVTTDEKYAYLIGNFSNEKSANHFLKNVILGRFPEAKIQAYENGERL